MLENPLVDGQISENFEILKTDEIIREDFQNCEILNGNSDLQNSTIFNEDCENSELLNELFQDYEIVEVDENLQENSDNLPRKITFTAAGHIKIPITVNGIPVNAVVDTGAQCSMLNKDFVNNNLPTLKSLCKLTVKGITAETMKADCTETLTIGIGDQFYREKVAIGPMSDDFLLGLDIILKYGIDILGSQGSIKVGSVEFPIDTTLHEYKIFSLRCVTLRHKIVVPPHTELCVPFQFSPAIQSNSEFFTFCPVEHPLIIFDSVVFRVDHNLPLIIINDNDHHVTLKSGYNLGVIIDTYESDIDSAEIVPEPILEIKRLNAELFPDSFPADESPHFSTVCDSVADHVRNLFKRSASHITLYQSVDLANLLNKFSHTFSTGDTDLGHYKGVYHHIYTTDDKPIKQRMRRTPFHFEKEEEAHLQKMLDSEVITESSSEYAHPVCLVRKRDGGVRWCIDLRALNAVTVKDAFPLPKIEQCLDTLRGTQFYSTLDLAAGYWQIEIAPEDRHKTAFLTKFGLFEHKKMGFGLCNAPATFQRAMQKILTGMLWKQVLVYIDDVFVLGECFETAMSNLHEVLRRFSVNNLKMKAKKCDLFQKEVEYLGRLVSAKGVTLKPGHIELMRKWPIPKTKNELEAFLGFANYHRNYMKNYSELVDPLYQFLAKSKAGAISLVPELVAIIEIVREKLINAPILPYPNPEYTFILDCDASNIAIGCELSQEINGEEKVISYASFSLTPAQRRYCTTRKELLSVVRFTEHFKHYLLGKPFICRTDHNSLTWLLSFKNIEGQLARWLECLSQFDMTLIHRAGKQHVNADVLSRIPDVDIYCPNYKANVQLTDLPCFQNGQVCKYCQKIQDQWSRFENDIDYVVPLTVRVTEVENSSENSDAIKANGPEYLSEHWFPKYKSDELMQYQESDTDLGKVIQWLKEKIVPTQAELALSSPETRHYWQLRDQLFFSNGVLFYKWEDPLEPKILLVVPFALREEVMKMNHDIVDAGHMGQRNTYLRVKNSFYWFRIRNSCSLYVKTCAKCNTNKRPNRRRRASLGEFHAGAPMDRVHIDILGPMTKTPRNNTVILILIDQFTKWVECYALPDQSAELLAKTIVDEFFTRFGCPLEIHTDKGTNFMSSLFSSMCNLLQITKKRTTGYRPQSNGQVERINRTVLQMLRCFRGKNIRDWDLYLPQIASAIRATPNRSTGFTPNKLMLGREVNKPSNLVFDIPHVQETQTPENYVQNLEQIIRKSHDEARENLRQNVAVSKRDYDLRINQAKYNVGDMVYMLNEHRSPGISKKLQPIYGGPYLIVKVISNVLFKLRNRKKEFVAHHDRLIECNDRFVPIWLRRMRQQYLNLDDTIPYDEDEDTEDVNQYSEVREIPNLFRTPDEFDNNGLSDFPIPDPQHTSTSIEELTPSSDFNTPPESTNTSYAAATMTDDTSVRINSDSNVNKFSRRGREIKRPLRYLDYDMDADHD